MQALALVKVWSTAAVAKAISTAESWHRRDMDGSQEEI
jgi:hypothetical protein